MTRPTTLPVALIQERNHGGAEENLAAIEARVAEAKQQGAKLVLLQELHNGPYFCQHEAVDEFDRAETIPGPSTERLSRLAASATRVSITARLASASPWLRSWMSATGRVVLRVIGRVLAAVAS